MSKRVGAIAILPSGYRFEFEGKRNWRASSSERWETVLGDDERGKLLGFRSIDGTRCAVVRVGKKIFAVNAVNLRTA